jgi:hypothetical protein
MLFLRGNHKASFALLTMAILLFGKKRPSQEEAPTRQRTEPFPIPDILRKSVSNTDATKARDRLRLAELERDILGDAMTKIYEAEAKGIISEAEKNQLLQRYKTDLKRVDGELETHQKVVDLYELESAKEDLLKSFHEKMLEIDARISQIKPVVNTSSSTEVRTAQTSPSPAKTEPASPAPAQTNTNKERSREKPKNKADEKIETIREEVLKAMERLEQIETEG